MEKSFQPNLFEVQSEAIRLKSVSTIDFHITSKCKQACPYCWGPRRFRNPVDTENAKCIISRIWDLGVRRIVFTGGDPLLRQDAPELISYAKELGLETALSTTGDQLTSALLDSLAPHLDLISLPLDGSTEDINSLTKHSGHFFAVMQALELLRYFPNIDVKVCTPVTRYNLKDVPAIMKLVADYSTSTKARVFYNVFQAFPRAMFSVRWEKLLVSEEEFASLKHQVGEAKNIRINFLDHSTLDKLYVMVFPDGSMTIPKGSEYLDFGPFLEVRDFGAALSISQFDSDKHLRHSSGWSKGLMKIGKICNQIGVESYKILNS